MVRENHDAGESGRKAATFIVHVRFCQGSTWQGTIVWAEENQTEHFRSELEMLKLMDSALDQADSCN